MDDRLCSTDGTTTPLAFDSPMSQAMMALGPAIEDVRAHVSGRGFDLQADEHRQGE